MTNKQNGVVVDFFGDAVEEQTQTKEEVTMVDMNEFVPKAQYVDIFNRFSEKCDQVEKLQKFNINEIAYKNSSMILKNQMKYLGSLANALVNEQEKYSPEFIAERLESCVEYMIELMVEVKFAREDEIRFERVTEKRKARKVSRRQAASEPKASERPLVADTITVAVDNTLPIFEVKMGKVVPADLHKGIIYPAINQGELEEFAAHLMASDKEVDALSAINERRFGYANHIAGIRYLASNYHMNKSVVAEQWVEVVDYNEVIKENKDAWANEDAAAVSEPKASEQQQQQEQHADADAVASVDYDKVFEYVGSNNIGVKFLQKGVMVTIAWSKQHAVPFIKVGDNKAKTQMIQTAIDKFKKFKNGEHGDVAQIVKTLTRIKKMPAEVLASKKQKERAAKEGSSSARKENTSTRRRSGTVDADWLAEYRREFQATHDRQPTGNEIKSAWESVQA